MTQPKPELTLEQRAELDEAMNLIWTKNDRYSLIFVTGKVESYRLRGYNISDYQFELLQYSAYMSREPMVIGLNGR